MWILRAFSEIVWRELKARLARSRFRSRFRLGPGELRQLAEKSPSALAGECERVLRERLAPAFPGHDGRQTPWRGHPCFVAQHATGCCCRHCLARWHGIPPRRELTAGELAYVLAVVLAWIRDQSETTVAAPRTPDLF